MRSAYYLLIPKKRSWNLGMDTNQQEFSRPKFSSSSRSKIPVENWHRVVPFANQSCLWFEFICVHSWFLNQSLMYLCIKNNDITLSRLDGAWSLLINGVVQVSLYPKRFFVACDRYRTALGKHLALLMVAASLTLWYLSLHLDSFLHQTFHLTLNCAALYLAHAHLEFSRISLQLFVNIPNHLLQLLNV